MKGYKAFDKNLKCKGFQYEIGEIYEMKDALEICKKGFHFCKIIYDCYKFYPMNEDTRICEVEAIGDIISDGKTKYCTNRIRIVREVEDLQRKGNIFPGNEGYMNTGKKNKGDWNSGSYNSGEYNSGVNNSGDYNSGMHNLGDYNSGDGNSGNYNSGDWNSGHHNSGYFNSTSWSSGCFNTEIPKMTMFNKPTDWTINDWKSSMVDRVFMSFPNNIQYAQDWWNKLPENYRQTIFGLPNFDAEIFLKCTGIDVNMGAK